jgi:hypothetical protein
MPKPAGAPWFELFGLPKVGKSRASSAARIVAFETASLVAALNCGRSRRSPRAPGWSKKSRPDGSVTISNSTSASKRTPRASSWPYWERRLKVPPGEVH